MRILPIDPLNQDWNDEPNWDLIAFCCFFTSNNFQASFFFFLPVLSCATERKPIAAGPHQKRRQLCFWWVQRGRGAGWGVCGGMRGGAGRGVDGSAHGVTRDQESMEVNVRL